MVEVVERSSARGTRVYELRPAPPYAFDQALIAMHYSPSVVLDATDPAGGSYRRALRLAGRELLLAIQARGPAEAPLLRLEVRAEGLDDEAGRAAVAFARRVFRLDLDPAPFDAIAARDPVLGAQAARFPGLRPVLVPDPFEALLFAVIGQQINVRFARTLKERLVALAGQQLVVDGVSYPLFPTPAWLAALEPEELAAHQFSRQKASYLVGLSRAVQRGELDLEAIGTLPQEEAIAALTAHKGIGRWTAEYLLMRGYGAPDSIPAADLGLRDSIGKAYLGRRASEAEVRAIAEGWAGQRSWAAFLWWLSLHVK
ncbi:MAG TPA: AlkA N-terminal domain-containing protein [Thermomicrobiaceae bacterium]|nr:AlkA N-terminal domain-containing protein [Thermomicrobiaceae bacterium]